MDDKKYAQIIKNYSRFFVFVFKYLIVLIALVVVVLLFKNYFLNPAYQWEHSDPYFIQKTKLVGSFEKFLKQTVQDNTIQIYILQGKLTTQDNFILSQDNLISYKGFIVPQYFSIATTLPVKQISYFDSPSYATGELEQVVNNLVLTKKFTVDQDQNQTTQIPITNGLISSFNLKCLTQNTIYPSTCAYYIRNFLSSFFVYKVSDDYTGLQEIFSHLQDTSSYRATFCAAMQKYVLYSNDKSEALKSIFDACGDTYKDFFRRMELFISIENQLDDKLLTTDVYKDPLLNAYKLLSFQQLLYNDLIAQRIQPSQYTSYMDFVNHLLQEGTIPHFYFDEIYRFNNDYLDPTLQSARYITTLSSDKVNQISQAMQNIQMLNIGSPSVSGLNDLIGNTSLLSPMGPVSVGQTISPQDAIMKQLQTISYLGITTSSIHDNQIVLSGYFLLDQGKIPTALQLLATNDAFIVQGIVLPGYPTLTQTLQALVDKQNVSLGELFASLSKNISLYQNDNTASSGTINPCDDIRSLETPLGIQVSTCTVDTLVFQKNINGQAITYSFLLDNGAIVNISISNDTLQSYIQNFFQQNQYSNLSVLDAIKSIVAASPDAFSTPHEGTTNTLAVLSDFNKYLHITPNDIAEQSGKIFVDFTLAGIDFIAGYKNHVLAPRYFKDLLVDGKPLIIKGLSLSLDDNHQTDIANMSKDPLTSIKGIDLAAWQNYMKR